MPFVASRRLEDMLNPDAARIAAKAMADKGGTRLMEATKLRTPIDTSYTPIPSSRPRGTARESVQRGPVKSRIVYGSRAYEVRVFTEDPVFPYIEWTTRPHLITPTPEHQARAAAEGRRAMLMFYAHGRIMWRPFVFHPGTQGQHPFARAAAFIQAEAAHMFGEELAQFARDLTPTRTGRIIDRTGRGSVSQIMNASVASWIKAHTIQIPRSGRRAVTDILGGGLGA